MQASGPEQKVLDRTRALRLLNQLANIRFALNGQLSEVQLIESNSELSASVEQIIEQLQTALQTNSADIDLTAIQQEVSGWNKLFTNPHILTQRHVFYCHLRDFMTKEARFLDSCAFIEKNLGNLAELLSRAYAKQPAAASPTLNKQASREDFHISDPEPQQHKQAQGVEQVKPMYDIIGAVRGMELTIGQPLVEEGGDVQFALNPEAFISQIDGKLAEFQQQLAQHVKTLVENYKPFADAVEAVKAHAVEMKLEQSGVINTMWWLVGATFDEIPAIPYMQLAMHAGQMFQFIPQLSCTVNELLKYAEDGRNAIFIDSKMAMRLNSCFEFAKRYLVETESSLNTGHGTTDEQDQPEADALADDKFADKLIATFEVLNLPEIEGDSEALASQRKQAAAEGQYIDALESQAQQEEDAQPAAEASEQPEDSELKACRKAIAKNIALQNDTVNNLRKAYDFYRGIVEYFDKKTNSDKCNFKELNFEDAYLVPIKASDYSAPNSKAEWERLISFAQDNSKPLSDAIALVNNNCLSTCKMIIDYIDQQEHAVAELHTAFSNHLKGQMPEGYWSYPIMDKLVIDKAIQPAQQLKRMHEEAQQRLSTIVSYVKGVATYCNRKDILLPTDVERLGLDPHILEHAQEVTADQFLSPPPSPAMARTINQQVDLFDTEQPMQRSETVTSGLAALVGRQQVGDNHANGSGRGVKLPAGAVVVEQVSSSSETDNSDEDPSSSSAQTFKSQRSQDDEALNRTLQIEEPKGSKPLHTPKVSDEDESTKTEVETKTATEADKLKVLIFVLLGLLAGPISGAVAFSFDMQLAAFAAADTATAVLNSSILLSVAVGAVLALGLGLLASRLFRNPVEGTNAAASKFEPEVHSELLTKNPDVIHAKGLAAKAANDAAVVATPGSSLRGGPTHGH